MSVRERENDEVSARLTAKKTICKKAFNFLILFFFPFHSYLIQVALERERKKERKPAMCLFGSIYITP